MTVKIFSYTGSLQSITLPKSITQVYLQAWGGARGRPVAFTSYGGAGGKVASGPFYGSSGGGRSGVSLSSTLPQVIIAGWGGFGYLDTLLINGISLSAPQSSIGGISLPSNTTDPNYITGVGVANGDRGTGNGLVAITFAEIVLTKSVDKTFASLGETLTYSILLSNSSSSSLISINFLYTLPFGTSFVPNSLSQDGTLIIGSPNPPGVILPNNILPGGESTITFQVITVTIPNRFTFILGMESEGSRRQSLGLRDTNYI